MVNQNLNGHIRVDHMLYHQPTVRGLFNYVILSAVLSNHSDSGNNIKTRTCLHPVLNVTSINRNQ